LAGYPNQPESRLVLSRIKTLLPRPLRLVAVGLLATFAYGMFSLGFVWLAGFSAPLASLCGHALAGFISYFGHRIFTFEVTGEHNGAPSRFIVLNAISYLVACVSPWFAIHLFMLPDTAAILATALVLPAVNVLLIAKFVFRKPLLNRITTSEVKISHGV
jgi:putative flippase GtrA